MNGGLFSGRSPRFTRIARSYFCRRAAWTGGINPDIFGSMIQAVADDEERGALGMHYTSVPNILKVLNPLFLDDLRAHSMRRHNARKLLNCVAACAIRFSTPPVAPATSWSSPTRKCERSRPRSTRLGRRIEAWIKLENFRGIESVTSRRKSRVALIIAEYQCDVLHPGSSMPWLNYCRLKRD